MIHEGPIAHLVNCPPQSTLCDRLSDRVSLSAQGGLADVHNRGIYSRLRPGWLSMRAPQSRRASQPRARALPALRQWSSAAAQPFAWISLSGTRQPTCKQIFFLNNNTEKLFTLASFHMEVRVVFCTIAFFFFSSEMELSHEGMGPLSPWPFLLLLLHLCILAGTIRKTCPVYRLRE